MKANVLFKPVLIPIFFCFLCLAVSFPAYIKAQGLDAIAEVDTEISNSSCSSGGQMWVCGTSEVLQAHRDFDRNCDGWIYDCDEVLRTVIDVCSERMRRSEIYADGANCRRN